MVVHMGNPYIRCNHLGDGMSNSSVPFVTAGDISPLRSSMLRCYTFG